MTSGGDDPFGRLGLPADASLDDVRAARRRLAKDHHPDHGGDAAMMRSVNAAFDAAVRTLLQRPPPTALPATETPPERPPSTGATRPRRDPGPPTRAQGVRPEHDAPSFTIDVLPAAAFEALLVVTSWHGDVHVDDPPYMLEVHLDDPAPCWCRLELLPEAGGTIVNLTVLPARPGVPTAEEVRDLWVASLNALGPDA